MTDLSQFTPLDVPREHVVCRDAEMARNLGHKPFEYPKAMSDGSRPATYREYEMWMLGRKYAHALHAGTLRDEDAMAEAHELAETTQRKIDGWHRAKCWSPDNQRSFLDLLAGGASVTEACSIVEMSKQSAYRHRARDAYFAVAWDAAIRLARPRVLDDFVERARSGQLETWKRISPEGKMTIVERRRYDNTHAMRVLQHLATGDGDDTRHGARVADAAENFDAWLAAIGTPDAAAAIDDETDFAEAKARRAADPLPELGDSDFANELRELFATEYADEDDEDEDEDGDEDGDEGEDGDGDEGEDGDENEGEGEDESDDEAGEGEVTGDEKVTVASHPASPGAPADAEEASGDGTQSHAPCLNGQPSPDERTDDHGTAQGTQERTRAGRRQGGKARP